MLKMHAKIRPSGINKMPDGRNPPKETTELSEDSEDSPTYFDTIFYTSIVLIYICWVMRKNFADKQPSMNQKKINEGIKRRCLWA